MYILDVKAFQSTDDAIITALTKTTERSKQVYSCTKHIDECPIDIFCLLFFSNGFGFQ